jgi:L-2,4-diaminobutyric acid acetyltransferase
MEINDIRFRPPVAEDGAALNELVTRCPPLDPNSVYCNLLQCTDFADTSIAADDNGRLIGFASGYRPPARPDTLFVWQVALDEQYRGRGIAKAMLVHLFERLQTQGVCCLETTISPGNRASEKLFRSLFRTLNLSCQTRLLFGRDRHFGGRHDDEVLYRAEPVITQETNSD